MPSLPDNTQAITQTVNRYIELIGKGSAADIAALYSDDAVVEDPVGGEIYRGRDAIRGFYTAIENLNRESELVTLRVAGGQAALHFRLTLNAEDNRMRIEPIDVMTFDDDAKITTMKAYWSVQDVTQL
jgi:steroid Delta-isomerase